MDLITELQQRKHNVEKLEGGRETVRKMEVVSAVSIFQTLGDWVDFYVIVDLVFIMLLTGTFYIQKRITCNTMTT